MGDCPSAEETRLQSLLQLLARATKNPFLKVRELLSFFSFSWASMESLSILTSETASAHDFFRSKLELRAWPALKRQRLGLLLGAVSILGESRAATLNVRKGFELEWESKRGNKRKQKGGKRERERR